MSDLLIRNIKPQLKRKLVERAKKHGNSLSAEAQEVMERGLSAPVPEKDMAAYLYSLIRPEDRGDDLVFEIKGEIGPAPDLE